LLAENKINDPAAFGMGLLLAEVVGKFRMSSFKQGVVQGEGAVLVAVQSLGQLNNGRRPVVRERMGTEWIAEYVTHQISLGFEFNGLDPEIASQILTFQR